ncbi:hypothetical protein [Corallococcus sp. M7]
MSTFYKRLLTASMGLVGLNGCVYGFIYDSATGSAVEGVTVYVASGTCSGTGCGTGLATQTTDSSGLYVFDAYGNRHGEDNVQLITAASGEEAVRLVYSRAGYRSVTVHHRPKYTTMTQDGNEYEVSAVQSVYLCALNAVDTDGDGVCDAAENQYGTNPNNPDTDGDRLSDFAELYGYGGVDLRYWGADPLKKDVFVEVDYYADRKPTQGALDRVTAAFANAPVSNPNGTTGIALHLVLDSQIAAADVISNLDTGWVGVDTLKSKYFKSRRAPFFHYALFANTYGTTTSSGLSRGIPAHDLIVTLGGWSTPGGTELQQAGTLMHELGHNIGLQHGGNDSANYKPNYLSVMNYEYQTFGLRIDGVDNVLDYSRVRVASVSETSVNEVSAFAPIAPTTEADLARIGVRINGVQRTGTASANLDINGSGAIQAASFAYNFNRDTDSVDLFPASQHDWLALVYDGAGQIGDGWLGTTQGLSRQQPFFVVPEKTDSCLTEQMLLKR